MDYNEIRLTFDQVFGAEAQLFRSPGRINIIGEHTDYNEGFVLPAAIDKEIVVAMAPNGRDKLCRIYASDLDEHFEFEMDAMSPVDLGWPNYVMGVVDQIQKRGKQLASFDAVIGGDVPLGAGLSSSAALEAVIAFALNHMNQLNLDKIELIKISQLAEHTFAGVMCGIMDQYASVMGKKDKVFRLDCRSLEHEYYPIDLGAYQILLINSNVKHSLASTEYNTRRQECETGVGILSKYHPEVKSLRDVTISMLDAYRDELPEVIFRRCKFVVEENDRVLKSCAALNAGQLELLGQLIYQSHEGLSKDYEVSCPELDFLVELSLDKDYVLGSRMMGGGFGGCTLNVIRKDKVQDFIKLAEVLYREKFAKSPTPILVSIEEGSSKI
jgi:galactokinase